MVCRAITSKPGKGAYTVLEITFAMGIGALIFGALIAFCIYNARSFAALSNWMDLDQANRLAIDQMTREIRQVNKMTACTTNSAAFEDNDGKPLEYKYDPVSRVVTRTKDGTTQTMLKECDEFTFNIYQRNIIEGSFNYYPADNINECKVVGVSWVCSRTILGQKSQMSGSQTAQIVIRKF